MKNPFSSSAAAAAPPTEIISAERVESSDSFDKDGPNKTATTTAADVAHAREDLEKIEQAHRWDFNLPQGKLDAVKQAIRDDDPGEILEADHLFSDNSPYEEVRAAVRTEDGEEPANTLRAWILGMLFVTVGSGANMFLSMR